MKEVSSFIIGLLRDTATRLKTTANKKEQLLPKDLVKMRATIEFLEQVLDAVDVGKLCEAIEFGNETHLWEGKVSTKGAKSIAMGLKVSLKFYRTLLNDKESLSRITKHLVKQLATTINMVADLLEKDVPRPSKKALVKEAEAKFQKELLDDLSGMIVDELDEEAMDLISENYLTASRYSKTFEDFLDEIEDLPALHNLQKPSITRLRKIQKSVESILGHLDEIYVKLLDESTHSLKGGPSKKTQTAIKNLVSKIKEARDENIC